eukprot:1487209-Pleurochrysis_carterae.AAC.2
MLAWAPVPRVYADLCGSGSRTMRARFWTSCACGRRITRCTALGERSGRRILLPTEPAELYAFFEQAWQPPLQAPCCSLQHHASILNKVSDYKQKSTYAHMTVFIVPQQLFEHGNTWCYYTAAIESRGAQLKHLGRSTVSWQPAVDGWTSYDYVDSRTNQHMKRQ